MKEEIIYVIVVPIQEYFASFPNIQLMRIVFGIGNYFPDDMVIGVCHIK
jgi:hypothetical protein